MMTIPVVGKLRWTAGSDGLKSVKLSWESYKAIRKAIRAAGAKLIFLPSYSSDLNPIEQVFAKLKTLLRQANARTIEAVTRAIGKLLDEYTVAECANYLVNSGYRST